MRFRYIFIILGVCFVILLPLCAPGKKTAVLFDDDFRRTRTGMYSVPLAAHAQYHYYSYAAPRGRWEVTSFMPDRRARQGWHVEHLNADHVLSQTFVNPYGHTHPMVAAGDSLWQDYTVKAWFSPLAKNGQSGIVFRYQNDRCYYFFGVDGSKAILKRVSHGTGYHQPREEMIAQRLCSWTPGKELTATVTVSGSHITAKLNKGVVIEADDDMFPKGRVALMSDIPARYHRVRVTTSPEKKEAFLALRAAREREAEERQAANPEPVLWKKVDTEGFGTGRNLRFGDLDGDGDLDMLIGQMNHHAWPNDTHNELACLTAMTFDGDILWQKGEPNPAGCYIDTDVAFQIHDIDGDGNNEAIYCRDFEIVVADGATGEPKYTAPTPDSRLRNDKFPKILGDCLYFADFRGTGYDRDMVIKDRYRHFWVLNDRLELLWSGSCNTGHYPYAYDIDGDRRDEMVMGYSLYDHTGKRLWSLDKTFKDHANAVGVTRFRDGQDIRILFAAGDTGLFFTDRGGTVLKHHYAGHCQNPAIANFRDDRPGLESLAINFWGSQGIVTYYDADGERYYEFEPNQYGSMCLPVNWTGNGTEYFVHNTNHRDGGMFDGRGQRVVVFPDDGHPDMCYAALDLTGDCRDEIVTWDQYRIWIYTQDDSPKSGRLYNPVRNPLYNYSNYQATVSLPGWSE